MLKAQPCDSAFHHSLCMCHFGTAPMDVAPTVLEQQAEPEAQPEAAQVAGTDSAQGPWHSPGPLHPWQRNDMTCAQCHMWLLGMVCGDGVPGHASGQIQQAPGKMAALRGPNSGNSLLQGWEVNCLDTGLLGTQCCWWWLAGRRVLVQESTYHDHTMPYHTLPVP